MKAKAAPALVAERFTYCPDTGVVRYRVGPKAGQEVGSDNPDGYRRIHVFGRQSLAHHVAWVLATGAWPVEDLDHINGVKDDNRLCNLREVGTAENCKNRRRNVNNTSGWNGVWHCQGRWIGMLREQRQRFYVGSYRCPTAAGIAVARKARELGFHENHGKPREAA